MRTSILLAALFAIACNGVGREALNPVHGPNGPGSGIEADTNGGNEPDLVTGELRVLEPDAEEEPEVVLPPDLVIGPDGACIPDCGGKECGDDGCGNACGTCPPGVICMDGQCNCKPDCWGQECGDDGCGGQCGTCPPGAQCVYGFCEYCEPDCWGQECGDDGCGGLCGICPDGFQCSPWGTCEGEPPPPGDSDCAEIFECFEWCGEDQACYQQCLNDATPEGQAAYYELVMCLDESGYFECPEWDEECFAETFEPCYGPYYACFHGDLSCLDMYLCYIGCPAGWQGEQCVNDCFANGSVEALMTWNELTGCLNDTGYFECPQNDGQCFVEAWEPCNPIFEECAHGDWSCAQVADCLEGCTGMDEICYYDCYLNGSIEAQHLYDEVQECVEAECGPWGGQGCKNKALKGPCKGLYDNCLAP
jgi:hypothetical protein